MSETEIGKWTSSHVLDARVEHLDTGVDFQDLNWKKIFDACQFGKLYQVVFIVVLLKGLSDRVDKMAEAFAALKKDVEKIEKPDTPPVDHTNVFYTFDELNGMKSDQLTAIVEAKGAKNHRSNSNTVKSIMEKQKEALRSIMEYGEPAAATEPKKEQ